MQIDVGSKWSDILYIIQQCIHIPHVLISIPSCSSEVYL